MASVFGVEAELGLGRYISRIEEIYQSWESKVVVLCARYRAAPLVAAVLLLVVGSWGIVARTKNAPQVVTVLELAQQSTTEPANIDGGAAQAKNVGSGVNSNQTLTVKSSSPVLQRVVAKVSESAEMATPKPVVMIVARRDSLSKVLGRAGVRDGSRLAKDVLALKEAQSLKGLRVGDKISLSLATLKDGLIEPRSLSYAIDDLSTLQVTWANHKPRAAIKRIEPTVVVKYASAKVEGSIYAAGKKHGVPYKLVHQMVGALSGSVDPKRIRSNDRFSLFYREYLANGKRVRDSEVVAAELTHGDRLHRVIAFKDQHGKTEFYTPDGHSVKPAFERYPLDSRRVGSRFSLARKHPILGIVRPHLGVDFLAKTGAPVKSTCNGRVIFAGYKNGYGRSVVIKNGIYTTLYAHLSRFPSNLAQGKAVSRGEVVGYVGSSGLSTGPHLHYEFLVNGVHRDPLKVALPKGEVVGRDARMKFLALSKNIVAQLDAHHRAHRSFALHRESRFE